MSGDIAVQVRSAPTAKLTQAGIAAALGVSQAAVSLVQRDPDTPRASPATKARILRYIQEWNVAAGWTRKGGTVSFVLPRERNPAQPFVTQPLMGAEVAAAARGLSVRFRSWSPHEGVDHLLSNDPGLGYILADHVEADVVAAIAARAPVVLMNQAPADLPYDAAYCDGGDAMARAVLHLAKIGHERIAFLGLGFRRDRHGRIAQTNLSSRYGGYVQGLLEAGLACDPDLVCHIGLRESRVFEHTREAMAHLLERSDPPTALIAFNDVLAASALDCVLERGFSVPGDMSIIGFDDDPVAVACRPSLTTFAQPYEDVGASALRLLCDRIDGETPKIHRRIGLPARFIERASCAPRS